MIYSGGRSASDVSERLLERTGNALMADRFDDFVDCFELPYHLETLDGACVLTSIPEMQATFAAVRQHLNQLQVTIMARHCVSANYRSEHEVAATHETRLISNGVLIQQPYPTFSILRRQPGQQWRIHSSSYVIIDSASLNEALTSQGHASRRAAT